MRADADTRLCDHPDCCEAGLYRAPRTRALDEYLWFCLEHVRAYNAAWDFYRGMSRGEIEAALRADISWQRPSWPFGAARRIDTGYRIRDDFGVFGEDPANGAGKRPNGDPFPPGREAEGAYAVLELPRGAGPEEIRARYVALVKELHPDANGGDKEAEERLKLVNDAYTTLKNANVI